MSRHGMWRQNEQGRRRDRESRGRRSAPAVLTLPVHRPLIPGSGPPDTPAARQDRPRSSWGVLRYPAFRLYFAGSLVSNLGTWVQNTAQVLLMYQLTHSVLAVGVVISAQFAGSLFLGPTAAVVASRLGGRRMLISAQLVSALVAAGLAVLQAAGHLSAPALTAGALVLGLAFTFGLPVQTALVPRLAPDTEAALAMNSVSYNAGRALAPILCVAVIAFTGFTWAFALNAVSFAVFAATLFLLTPGPGEETRRRARARDGFVQALRQPRIMLTLAMVAAVTFADDPILILGPALAHQLNASSDWTGYFLSALGLGTILGSFRIGAKKAGQQTQDLATHGHQRQIPAGSQVPAPPRRLHVHLRERDLDVGEPAGCVRGGRGRAPDRRRHPDTACPPARSHGERHGPLGDRLGRYEAARLSHRRVGGQWPWPAAGRGCCQRSGPGPRRRRGLPAQDVARTAKDLGTAMGYGVGTSLPSCPHSRQWLAGRITATIVTIVPSGK